MDIIITLMVLLSSALILGSIADKFGIPKVVAYIIAGMLLGHIASGLLSYGSELSGISEVSLFFIMLMVGIEATTELLTKHIRSAVMFTISSFIIPVAIMIAVSVFAFGLDPTQALVTSMAIGVPSISIISVLVMRYDLLRIDDGARMVSSVVLTDVIAFAALAAIGASTVPVYVVVLSILAFVLALLFFDGVLRHNAASIRRLFIKEYNERHGEELIFAGVILIGLVGAALLQLAGITYVLGAFFAGLLIHDAVVGKRVYGILQRTFRRITNSFFIPVFFSIAGLQVAMPSDYLELMIVLVAISGAVGGALDYIVGLNRLKELGPMTAVALLGSRGAVGIIIADIALLGGVISINLYSIIILGTVVLSLILPVMLGGEGRLADAQHEKNKN
jgi:Kef-type K+ transport system membrane component KefB